MSTATNLVNSNKAFAFIYLKDMPAHDIERAVFMRCYDPYWSRDTEREWIIRTVDYMVMEYGEEILDYLKKKLPEETHTRNDVYFIFTKAMEREIEFEHERFRLTYGSIN